MSVFGGESWNWINATLAFSIRLVVPIALLSKQRPSTSSVSSKVPPTLATILMSLSRARKNKTRSRHFRADSFFLSRAPCQLIATVSSEATPARCQPLKQCDTEIFSIIKVIMNKGERREPGWVGEVQNQTKKACESQKRCQGPDSVEERCRLSRHREDESPRKVSALSLIYSSPVREYFGKAWQAFGCSRRRRKWIQWLEKLGYSQRSNEKGGRLHE